MTIDGDYSDHVEDMAGAGGRDITAIYWHYSESPDVSAATIDQWHKARGWKGIGYHYVIRKDGSVERGRSDEEVGAHVVGHNSYSLGVCITGSDTLPWYPTDAQYATAARLGREKMAEYGITLARATMFHRDSQATSCPGRLDRERLRRQIGTNVPIEEDDMGHSMCRNLAARGTLMEGHAWLGKLGPRTEHCYLHLTGVAKNNAKVAVTCYSDAVVKNVNVLVALNKHVEVNLEDLGVTGAVTWRVQSDEVVLVSPDWRVEW